MSKDLYKLADELEDIICNLDLSEHTSSRLYNIANGIRDYQLNDEVEDKKIERLQWCNIEGDSTKAQLLELRENVLLQFDKIIEIIDYINKEDNK